MALEKLVVTVPEAGEMTSTGRSKSYELVASGEWPSIRVGRSVRVPVEGLKAWVEQRTRAAASLPAKATHTESRSPGLHLPRA